MGTDGEIVSIGKGAKALVIGATGYVGSAICRKLRARGYDTHGMARSDARREALEAAGVIARIGNLDDLRAIRPIVEDYDVVILAAPLPRDLEPATVSAIIEASQKAGRTSRFVFTSGTGVISTESRDGAWSETSYSDDDEPPFPSNQIRALRVMAEELVRRSSGGRLSTTVMRPPLIYGNGGSNQVPAIFESVRKTGAACYLGEGLNLYSNVHVDDLAEAYCLALDLGSPGALYHTVAGEANFRSIAEAVAEVTGTRAKSVDYDEACHIWGPFWVEHALAVNSRSISPRARRELQWTPVAIDLIEDIRSGSYVETWSSERQPA